MFGGLDGWFIGIAVWLAGWLVGVLGALIGWLAAMLGHLVDLLVGGFVCWVSWLV